MIIAEELSTERSLLAFQRSKALVSIGIPIMVVFGIKSLRDGDWSHLILIVTAILIISSGFVAMLRGHNRTSIIRPSVATVAVLFLYLIANAGEEHSRALWFFAFPVLSIMMLPPREGLLWSLSGIAIASGIMGWGGQSFGTSTYSLAFTARFAITGILIAGCLYWSEIVLFRYQARLAAQKAALQAESARLKDEIALRSTLENELRILAGTDALTGLINRRAFMERFAHELERSQRHGPSPTLLILDIDHFKVINDTHGHPAGDTVLTYLAHILKTSVRNVDIIARIGGEEFAIVLVETNSEMAAPVIERLLHRLRNSPATLADGTLLGFTASIGSTEVRWGEPSDAAIQRADEALYAAKNGGRNCHRQL